MILLAWRTGADLDPLVVDEQPLVAQAIAMGFTAMKMETMYQELTEALETLEPGSVSSPFFSSALYLHSRLLGGAC